MSDHHDKQELERRLWKRLSDHAAGMLGLHDRDMHMQPMHPYVDEELKTLWFITSRDTDLVSAIGVGATAHFTVTDDDKGFYACMRGPIVQSSDSKKLDEIWSMVAASWFEGGRDDPNIVLLEMPLSDALVWASDESGLEFAIQIARANIMGGTPDVGTRAHLEFSTAA
ncbi:pyridoxamine 5'-phosphate oxidase family protein [Algicella marina]|nr:pyridoxamine 5'-phosphate oxidase family protein [Algicella marina]